MRLLLTCLLIVFCIQSFIVNASEWRIIGSKETNILFFAPGLENWTPRITVGVNDNAGGRMEWKCWRKFNNIKANSCVTYQHIPAGNFRFMRASDVPRQFKKFKKIEYDFKRPSFDVESAFGDANVIFFQTTFPKEKNCFSYSTLFDSRNSIVLGWYCASEGAAVDKDFATKAIASLGIQGSINPLRTSEIKYGSSKNDISPYTSPSKTGDVETRLREAKELFTKDLITEGEYDKLKKNILGIK